MSKPLKKKSDEREYFDRLAVTMEFVVTDPPDHVRRLLSGKPSPDNDRTITLEHDIDMLADDDFARKYRVRKEVLRKIMPARVTSRAKRPDKSDRRTST